MSKDNLEIVRRLYEVWNGPGPPEKLLPFCAEDFEYVNPSNAVEPGVRHGHEGVLEAQESLEAAFEYYEHEPGELVDLGERVLAWITFKARTRNAGLQYDKAEAQIWTLRDGLITRFEWFHDRDEALKAAGLPE